MEEALRRATERETPFEEDVIRSMHAAFANLGEYERHVLDTTAMPADEVAACFNRMRKILALPRG